MPKIRVNGLDHYYEQQGDGPDLEFVHGAFVDARLWEPQAQRFCAPGSRAALRPARPRVNRPFVASDSLEQIWACQ